MIAVNVATVLQSYIISTMYVNHLILTVQKSQIGSESEKLGVFAVLIIKLPKWKE